MTVRELALLDGLGTDIGQGAVVALVSIALVFLILGIIIAITYFIGLVIRKASASPKAPATPADIPADVWEGLDTKDEDMVAAVLVASIDYRQESGKNVKVVSVKEIR